MRQKYQLPRSRKAYQLLVESICDGSKSSRDFCILRTIGGDTGEVVVPGSRSRISARLLNSFVEKPARPNQMARCRCGGKSGNRNSVQCLHELMQLSAVSSSVRSSFRSERIGLLGRHLVNGVERISNERCRHPYQARTLFSLLLSRALSFQLVLKKDDAEGADDSQGRSNRLSQRKVIAVVPRHA